MAYIVNAYCYSFDESEEESEYNYEDNSGRKNKILFPFFGVFFTYFLRDRYGCLCCQDIQEMLTKTVDVRVSCITCHPGFKAVVLNPYVLETAFCGYHPHQDFNFE
ncbi:hypothetical protein XELAEV_18035890mg [Xenopus laevis]|uniref:Uncharacterized protein n=1 Tax=Xenopus laevis TaxID=8355 RepID=A0A974CGJ8_XENLA|nr:hypothetical protein XELAEV_18035890mg [Xenopus laevis]